MGIRKQAVDLMNKGMSRERREYEINESATNDKKKENEVIQTQHIMIQTLDIMTLKVIQPQDVII